MPNLLHTVKRAIDGSDTFDTFSIYFLFLKMDLLVLSFCRFAFLQT